MGCSICDYLLIDVNRAVVLQSERVDVLCALAGNAEHKDFYRALHQARLCTVRSEHAWTRYRVHIDEHSQLDDDVSPQAARTSNGAFIVVRNCDPLQSGTTDQRERMHVRRSKPANQSRDTPYELAQRVAEILRGAGFNAMLLEATSETAEKI